MIVVTYQEETNAGSASGTTACVRLGAETHQDIEEVVLPSKPEPGAPIFLTKKFAGRDEYRWEVLDVCQNLNAVRAIEYLVTLRRRNQVPKDAYLKNILAARGDRAKRVLRLWSFVEVEFGHSLTVGKANGHLRSTKRYVDTIQLYSMPKRRLAIVTQVIERATEDLVQVVPITSKRPHPSDRSSVEVTSCLSDLVNYQKQSWAICKMIQTVTASRIIAPMTKVSETRTTRDTGFRTSIRNELKEQLKDALMEGVSLGYRIGENSWTMTEERKRNAELTKQVSNVEAELSLYRQLAEELGMSIEELKGRYAPGGEANPSL